MQSRWQLNRAISECTYVVEVLAIPMHLILLKVPEHWPVSLSIRCTCGSLCGSRLVQSVKLDSRREQK